MIITVYNLDDMYNKIIFVCYKVGIDRKVVHEFTGLV